MPESIRGDGKNTMGMIFAATSRRAVLYSPEPPNYCSLSFRVGSDLWVVTSSSGSRGTDAKNSPRRALRKELDELSNAVIAV